MATAPVLTILREQYLAAERSSPTRSEYHLGYLVAMAGASRDRNRIVANLMIAIGNVLQDRDCNNYAADMRVSVRGGERYLYPDVVVTCGEERFEDSHRDCLVNPLLLIEVLSPSTEAYDRGVKFLAYQSIESLREYVLITPSPRRIEVFRRQPDGAWLYQSTTEPNPTLTLASLDCEIPGDVVFRKVEPGNPVG